MGIPVVSLKDRLRGARWVRRYYRAGRTEWIAETEADYIDKAVALAADTNTLAATAGRLARGNETSRLMDESGFARSWKRISGDVAALVEGRRRSVWGGERVVAAHRCYSMAQRIFGGGGCTLIRRVAGRSLKAIDNSCADSNSC